MATAKTLQDGKKESPEKKANYFSLLFFCWLENFVKNGYKKEPEISDLYNIADDKSSSYLCDRLEAEWRFEAEKLAKGGKASFHKALLWCFKWEFLITAILHILKDISRIAQPLLLARLLVYFEKTVGGSSADISTLDAYMYGLGLVLSSSVVPLIHHPLYFLCFVIGMRMKIGSCAILYRKMLRLSHKSLASTTTGHVVNLMSNDAMRLEFTALHIHQIWWGPIQAVAVLVILWIYLGPTSLAGYALVVVLAPAQGLLGKAYALLRTKTALQTDERIRLMDQVVSGIKVIKMYCWEKPFSNLISAIRRREMRIIAIASRMRLLSAELGSFSFSKIATAACILIHVILYGKMLSLENVVILMRLLVVVQDTLAYCFAKGVSYWSETSATCGRIQKFLLLEEIDMLHRLPDCDGKDARVVIEDVTCRWEDGRESAALSNVTLELAAGDLVAVVGPVGSGKSSLLMAILGELPAASGKIATKGSIAYASQQPWIFSSSIKENILFGAAYDAEKYHAAIEACDLVRDIESFANGHDTLVGERGVVLSGGQKARIGLARSLYRDADIYLLDDPLSAVDASVARHLFDRCISGALRNKVRVLVTHQLHFLQAAKRVLVLVNGEVKAVGTYSELVNSGVELDKLMKPPNVSAGEDRHPIVVIQLENGKAQSHVRQLENSSQSSDKVVNGPRTTPTAERSPYGNSEDVETRDGLFPSQINEVQEPPEICNVNSFTVDSHCCHTSIGDIAELEIPVEAPSAGEQEPMLCQKPDETSAAAVHVTSSLPSTKVVGVEPERQSKGAVLCSTYLLYFRTGGSVCALAAGAVLLSGGHTCFMLLDWYATTWAYFEDAYQEAVAESYQTNLYYRSDNSLAKDMERSNASAEGFTNMTGWAEIAYGPDTRLQRTIVYASLVLVLVLASCARTLALCQICLNASRKIHDSMFAAIVRTPMKFFDTNPIGRILNRFSKDMGTVDDQLPTHYLDFFTQFLAVVGTVAMAAAANPWILLLLVPIAAALYVIQRLYVVNSRAVKRLESITRSPVFSHVSTTLSGLHSVRAYRAEEAFIEQFDCHQDSNTEAFYMNLCLTRWLSIRLDLMCSLFIASTIFACLVFREHVDLTPSVFGLTVNYLVSLTGTFQYVVREITAIENLMTSVERIAEYIRLDPEAPLSTDVRSPPGWPQAGSIEANGLSISYGSRELPVLKDVSFRIMGSEKVGICGRTGAGKSSLLAALFRLTEPSGYLAIDGVRVTELGLHDLRSKISIIPQDPVLFSTNVRGNLDPFCEHADETLWDALRQSQLADAVLSLPGGLDAPVAECGSNFSVGQRQLLCLARAMLRRSRVLVVDEATANVDLRTDAIIQEAIRDKFRDCTVLTIAHRLETIMDCDRVMVLDDGTVREFGEPSALLERPDSLLRLLATHTGKNYDASEISLMLLQQARHHVPEQFS